MDEAIVPAGAVLVKSQNTCFTATGKTGTVSDFLGDRLGKNTENQEGVSLTDICKIGFH